MNSSDIFLLLKKESPEIARVLTEAASAGRLGGNSISKNREHMSRIGKAGGKNRAARAQLTAEEHRLLQQ